METQSPKNQLEAILFHHPRHYRVPQARVRTSSNTVVFTVLTPRTAPSTSAGKGKLGLKVDQLKKTNLSHQDIELLAVVLNMFVNHPDLSKDPIMRDYLKQYILQLSTATKAADAVTYQRFKLLHASTISFYRSFLKRSSGQLSDMDDISLLLPWHTHSYCPPIEYLEKTIVDKHPGNTGPHFIFF